MSHENGSEGRRELFIEKKQVIRLSCYKFDKHAAPKGATLQQQIAARNAQKCPHGFQEITPLCQHCVWFKTDPVAYDGRGVQADRPIQPMDIPVIARTYAEEEEAQKKGE